MRELLEKAHQEEDDLFAEAEDDEEFEAPRKSAVSGGGCSSRLDSLLTGY